MSDPISRAELMRTIGRLVRGLSALFWGLPLALVLSVQTAWTECLRPFQFIPPLAATGLLLFGLCQLGHFQPQERVWIAALERAKVLALILMGLTPFLWWWHQAPAVTWFSQALTVFSVCGLLLLAALNQVLRRLAAMLPDETVRQETRLFTTFSLFLLAALLIFLAGYLGLVYMPTHSIRLLQLLVILNREILWLGILLLLLPLAMTMALLWKIKGVILTSVFGTQEL